MNQEGELGRWPKSSFKAKRRCKKTQMSGGVNIRENHTRGGGKIDPQQPQA